MLRRRFIPAIRRKRAVDMNTVVIQQDGALLDCSVRAFSSTLDSTFQEASQFRD